MKVTRVVWESPLPAPPVVWPFAPLGERLERVGLGLLFLTAVGSPNGAIVQRQGRPGAQGWGGVGGGTGPDLDLQWRGAMEALAAALATAAAAERETKRALKQARDSLRYARILRLATVFIYVAANNSPDAALTYVRRQRPHWLKELELQDPTEAWLSDVIIAFPLEYFSRIGTLLAEYPDNVTYKPSYEEKLALQRQARFLREWGTQQWVLSRNRVGIAPRTAAVAHQLQEGRRGQRQPRLEIESPDRDRAQVYRWRRRWAARVKALRGGSSVDMETMRTKATAGRLVRCLGRPGGLTHGLGRWLQRPRSTQETPSRSSGARPRSRRYFGRPGPLFLQARGRQRLTSWPQNWGHQMGPLY